MPSRARADDKETVVTPLLFSFVKHIFQRMGNIIWFLILLLLLLLIVVCNKIIKNMCSSGNSARTHQEDMNPLQPINNVKVFNSKVTSDSCPSAPSPYYMPMVDQIPDINMCNLTDEKSCTKHGDTGLLFSFVKNIINHVSGVNFFKRNQMYPSLQP